MIINNFDFFRIAVPPEEAEFAIGRLRGCCANRLDCPLRASRRLAADPQVTQLLRLIQSDQFSQGRALNIRRQLLRRSALPNLFSLFSAERSITALWYNASRHSVKGSTVITAFDDESRLPPRLPFQKKREPPIR